MFVQGTGRQQEALPPADQTVPRHELGDAAGFRREGASNAVITAAQPLFVAGTEGEVASVSGEEEVQVQTVPAVSLVRAQAAAESEAERQAEAAPLLEGFSEGSDIRVSYHPRRTS